MVVIFVKENNEKARTNNGLITYDYSTFGLVSLKEEALS